MQEPYQKETTRLFIIIGVMALLALLVALRFDSVCELAVNLKDYLHDLDIERQRDILSSASNGDHGDSFEEVMLSLHDEDVEYIVLFDDHVGKLIEYTSSDTHSCSMPSRLVKPAIKLGACISLHNHPYSDSTFSRNDLVSSAQLKLRQSIVVSRKYVYILTANGDWPDPKEVNSFLQKNIHDQPDQAEKNGWQRIDEGTDGSKQYVYTDSFMEFFASTYNLVYEKIAFRNVIFY